MGDKEEKAYHQHRGLIRSMINSIVVNNPAIVSTEDLQQVGALALMIALRSYDPSLGSLQSYIRSCVRNALLEQANSFNGVFTVDEKVRRQANAVMRLRREGLSDEEIMSKLGIKTQATFLSLLHLVEPTIDVENVEMVSGMALEEDDITRLLDEIGLGSDELRFVNLVIQKHSMSDLERIMGLSRSQLYKLKSSIKDKILEWGQK